MLALATSVCLLALSHSGRRVLALLRCAGLVAPCGAVYAVDARRQRARTHFLKKPVKKKVLKKQSVLQEKEKTKGTRLARM